MVRRSNTMCSGIGTLLSTSSESRVRSDEGALDEDEAGVFQTTCTVTTPKRVLGRKGPCASRVWLLLQATWFSARRLLPSPSVRRRPTERQGRARRIAQSGNSGRWCVALRGTMFGLGREFICTEARLTHTTHQLMITVVRGKCLSNCDSIIGLVQCLELLCCKP